MSRDNGKPAVSLELAATPRRAPWYRAIPLTARTFELFRFLVCRSSSARTGYFAFAISAITSAASLKA